MLSGNQTTCLDIPMEGATWDDSDSQVSPHLWGFLSLCRDVPSAVGPGICGAGGGGWRTTGNVGFSHSYLDMKVKALMVLSLLEAWGVNLYPVTVASGTLSLCHLLAVPAPLQHLRLPWVGHGLSTLPIQSGEEEKWREKEDEKKRPGDIPWGGSAGQTME